MSISRNNRHQPQTQQGAASSAAKHRRSGIRERSGLWVYVPGEGFIKWNKIQEQVARAFRCWQWRQALKKRAAAQRARAAATNS